MPDLHTHRWRHSFSHEWKLAGADTGELMLLLGWASEDMPRRYGASAAAERAMETQQAWRATGERPAVQLTVPAPSVMTVDDDGYLW